MFAQQDKLRIEERVTLALQRIYEQYGYRKYRMGKFEEYDLYQENKSFLKSDSIITFTDPSGRLMALKPDVTLSIVKNAKPGLRERLYYIENVYRLSREHHEYREIKQAGLEFIGGDDIHAEAEVLSLAARSLHIISEKYVLDICHVGFLASLLEELHISEEQKEKLLCCVRHKSPHELAQAANDAAISAAAQKSLQQLIALNGNFVKSLAIARTIALNEGMMSALDQMEALYTALSDLGLAAGLRIDFSIQGDLDYYNGLLFRGYAQDIPGAILSGGRYDNLLHRLDKPQGAIGFAIYLDELGRGVRQPVAFDVDLLLLYDNNVDPAQLLSTISELIKDGQSVYAETFVPQGLRYRQMLRLDKGGLSEVSKC